MKTLIVYATKTGCTGDCAAMVSQKLAQPAKLMDLKTVKGTADGYDCVIIGTPIYMGRVMKEIADFVKRQEGSLLMKKVVFFTCGAGTAQQDGEYLRKCIPEALTRRAAAISHFGGEIRLDRKSPLERFAMKQMMKGQEESHFLQENIDEFCDTLNRLWYEGEGKA